MDKPHLNIVVCIKQVPDTDQISIDRTTNRLNRAGVPGIINPFDENALELALQLKDRHGANITVVSMGPPQAESMLRSALRLGADAAVLVSDPRFGGSDTWATSNILALAIQKLGRTDLILFGKQATDGDTAQVGPGVAQLLDLPVLTYVRRVELKDQYFKATKVTDDGYEVWEVDAPAAFTVVKEDSPLRLPTRQTIEAGDAAPITVWNADALGADETKIGLAGSPTQVIRTFTPPVKADRQMLSGEPQEMVAELIEKLRERNLL